MTAYLATNGRVGLRLPDRQRMETYLSWENDPQTLIAYGNQFPQPLSVRESGWDGQERNPNYQKFEVVTISEDVAVGLTTLVVDPFVRTAESILVLDPARRGEGLATEATRATLEVAFCVASLEMVWAKVLAPNVAAVAVCESAGLQRAGVLESAGWWRGSRCAEVLLSVTRDQYLAARAVAASELSGVENA